VINFKRWSFGVIEYFEFFNQNFNGSGFQIGIFLSVRTIADCSSNLDNIFWTYLIGDIVGVGEFDGITHGLSKPVTIA
jgi:hypothetical protein